MGWEDYLGFGHVVTYFAVLLCVVAMFSLFFSNVDLLGVQIITIY